MKTTLLRTTAIAAILMMSATAAQAEIKLDLGGFFKGYAGYSSQDTDDLREFDIKRKSELTFTGETTLDNGLTVGYEGQLIQENDANQIEDSYLYFSGSWGRVNLGRTYGAAYLLQVSAPGADANQDGQDIDFSFVNLGNSFVDQDYQHNGSFDDNHTLDSITYLTPKFNGFQAGATYSAAIDQKNRGVAPGTGNLGGMETDNDGDDFENGIEFGARYDGEFNGVGIHAGAGYSHATLENEAASVLVNDDFQEWNAGLKLTYNNFGFGGAYNTDNNAVDNNGDNDNWTVGADYTWGAYKFGASYFNSTAEIPAGTENDLDRYMVGATYTFGPGMDFRGAVGYYDLDVGATPADDNQATVVTVGTDIQF